MKIWELGRSLSAVPPTVHNFGPSITDYGATATAVIAISLTSSHLIFYLRSP